MNSRKVSITTKPSPPIVKFLTLHLLLAIAAIEDMDIDQMDFVTAFLNGELPKNEAVYMKTPQGARL